MINNTELYQIIMKQAQVIAQLTEQLAASVGAVFPSATVVPKDYDDTLTGSDLVREHFLRGGTALWCFIEDDGDDKAVIGKHRRKVIGIADDGRFIAELCNWDYAVACTEDGVVLTADQLLGGL